MSPDPQQVRLIASMPLLFRPSRLHYWFDQMRCLAEMQLAHTHVHIVTSTFAESDIQQINGLLRPLLSTQFTAEIESFWDPDDPKAMTWHHKHLFDSKFLNSDAFTHLLYLEDDLRCTWANLAYWLTYREILKSAGFIPSFVRYEYNLLNHMLYLSDCVDVTEVRHNPLLLGDEIFVMPNNPYCAMYVVDQELGAEYRQSASFDPLASQSVSGWPSTERSAMGPGFEKLPPNRLSRYVVPFDRERSRPHPGALIHHLPNNFANRQFPVVGYQHGALKLNGGFVW